MSYCVPSFLLLFACVIEKILDWYRLYQNWLYSYDFYCRQILRGWNNKYKCAPTSPYGKDQIEICIRHYCCLHFSATICSHISFALNDYHKGLPLPLFHLSSKPQGATTLFFSLSLKNIIFRYGLISNVSISGGRVHYSESYYL